MKKLMCLFLGVSMFLSCLTNSKQHGNVPYDVYIPADLMGMVHAGYANGNNDRLEEEYALLDEMGVRWMLRDFLWNVIQPNNDVWDWTASDKYTADAGNHDKKILGLLAYDTPWIHGEYNKRTGKYACGHSAGKVKSKIVAGQDEVAAFCEFVHETVLRYKGKVDAWCIWNEPNMSRHFWGGTPKEFFTLSKAAAAAIRKADPNAVIIGGALNPGADNAVWTRGLFVSGAMDQVDYFAYHPYAANAAASAEAYIRFRDYAAKYGFQDRVWVTEIGYPLNKGPGGYDTKVPEAFMPETTVKTITLLAAAGAPRIFWYEMFDYGKNSPPNDSEAWFGLVDFDTFSKKGGAEAYQLCARNLPGKILRAAIWEPGLPSIAAYYFEGADETHSLIIWNDKPAQSRQITVTLPGSKRQVWNVATGTSAPIIDETATYTLQSGAGNSLLFFTWENSDLSKTPEILGIF